MDDGGTTWIVVADGGVARIFAERRRAGDLVEDSARRMTSTDSDRPQAPSHRATVHQRVGGGRHAAKGPSLQDEAEGRFLKRVAVALTQAEASDAFDHLVILAPPRALGQLRQSLASGVARRLQASGPHDCVRETPERIRQRLRDLRAETWKAS